MCFKNIRPSGKRIRERWSYFTNHGAAFKQERLQSEGAAENLLIPPPHLPPIMHIIKLRESWEWGWSTFSALTDSEVHHPTTRNNNSEQMVWTPWLQRIAESCCGETAADLYHRIKHIRSRKSLDRCFNYRFMHTNRREGPDYLKCWLCHRGVQNEKQKTEPSQEIGISVTSRILWQVYMVKGSNIRKVDNHWCLHQTCPVVLWMAFSFAATNHVIGEWENPYGFSAPLQQSAYQPLTVALSCQPYSITSGELGLFGNHFPHVLG